MIGFLYVAAGGAIGSVCRYALSLIEWKNTAATFAANIIGCLIIGVLASMGAERIGGENNMLLLKTGFCGGFTTFSTFSLEAYGMLNNGEWMFAACYVLGSVLSGLAGVWIGMRI